MDLIQVGRSYKWTVNYPCTISRPYNETWAHTNLKKNDIFLLLDWISELKYVGGWEVNEYIFKIFVENQIWHLTIVIDLGEDYSLAEMFEIIC